MNTSSKDCELAELVLVGNGGHASVVAGIIGALGGSIVGYVAPVEGGSEYGSYLGSDAEFLSNSTPTGCGYVMGIGLPNVNPRRLALFDEFAESDLCAPAIVSHRATVYPTAKLGPGVIVCPGAVVGPGSVIGRCTIINHLASVDHDCEIGANCHIAPGAVLCGGVHVGDNALVGAGSIVLPEQRIIGGGLVKAGSVFKELTARN